MRILTSAALAAAMFSGPLAGAASAQSQSTLFQHLGRLIITGLTPVEAENSGRAITVVAREEIESRGFVTVQDALRALPGVAVNSTGASFTQVRIRGGEANHTLILIDGIPAAAGDSEYNLSGLDTANIERIELLRGPQSVAFGSDASSGVINIVTRRAGPGRTLDFAVEAGSAYRASAFLGQRGDRGGISLALSHLRDLGWDYSNSGGERDETVRSSAILSGDFQITETLAMDFTLRHSRERYDYDGNNWTPTGPDDYVTDVSGLYSDVTESTFGLGFDLETLGGRLVHRLSFQSTRNDQSYGTGPATDTRADALRYRLAFALDGGAVEGSNQLLTLRLDRERDSSGANPLYDRSNNSAALEYRGTFDALTVQAGVRHDDNSSFGDSLSWNLSMAYEFDSGIRLHSSAGTGVVNPSYFELYANAFGYVGNPNLTPERNRSYDIGLELPVLGGRGTVSATLFREVLTDEIVSVSVPGGGFTFVNEIGESRRSGIELAVRAEITEALALRLAYTRLRAHNPNGTIEARRPENELQLGATYQTFAGRGEVSADLRHVSGNWDNLQWSPFGLAELPSFTTLDLAAQYRLNERVTLVGRVSNVFDSEASESWGYVNRGRAAYIGLRASF